MSCSWIDSSICSRWGTTRTVTLKPLSPVSSQPGHVAVEHVEVALHVEVLAGDVLQGHDFAGTNAVRRDVDALAVDADVTVAHELAGLGARRTPAGAVGDVVETQSRGTARG